MSGEIKKFKRGETYTVRSIGDYDAVSYYRIVRRTKKSVWIVLSNAPAGSLGNLRRIEVFQGVETCFPEGRYSMAPILKASRPRPVYEKKHTLDRHNVRQEFYLQEAYKEGKEKGLEGVELWYHTEQRSLELWRETAR